MMRYSFFVLFLLSSSYSFAMDPPEEPSGCYPLRAQVAVPQDNDEGRVPIVPVTTSENSDPDPEEWGLGYVAFLQYLQRQMGKGVNVDEETLNNLVKWDPTRKSSVDTLRRRMMMEIQDNDAVQVPEVSRFWTAGHICFLIYLEREIEKNVDVDYDTIAALLAANDPCRERFLRELKLLMEPEGINDPRYARFLIALEKLKM